MYLLNLLLFAFLRTNICSAQMPPPLPPNGLTLPSTAYTIPFIWQGDSAGARWEPHTALLIPVRLRGCPKTFYMQFDTGSPYTVLYKSKAASIRKKYPGALAFNDSLDNVKDLSFLAGTMPVSAKDIKLKTYGTAGISWKDRKAIEIIGTIGTDLIDNRAALIDYPGKTITLAPGLEALHLEAQPLTDFIYVNRSILLPATVRGKKTILFFDSGSSAYELLTDSSTYASMALPGATASSHSSNSWGRTLTANTIATGDTLLVGRRQLALHEVSFIQGASSTQIGQMMKLGIGGMTGNKLFLPDRLLLDTKNKKFAVLPPRSKKSK